VIYSGGCGKSLDGDRRKGEMGEKRTEALRRIGTGEEEEERVEKEKQGNKKEDQPVREFFTFNRCV